MTAAVSREPDSWLDIATVAARYGVSLRTLRFYEHQGLLLPARQGSRRLYCAQDCIRLEIILKGKRLGLSLREIGALIGDVQTEKYVESPVIDHMTNRQLEERLEILQKEHQELENAIKELEPEMRKRDH